MKQTFERLHVHLVWATWERHPLIRPEVEAKIHAAISTKCRELECHVVAVGGTEDHIHLLVGFPAKVSIMKIAQSAKGVSSHLAGLLKETAGSFRWQRGYGAFVIERPHLAKVAAYINNQKAHHRDGSTIHALERCEEEVEPPLDQTQPQHRESHEV